MAICRLMRVKVRTRQQRLGDKNKSEDVQLRTQNNHDIEYLPVLILADSDLKLEDVI